MPYQIRDSRYRDYVSKQVDFLNLYKRILFYHRRAAFCKAAKQNGCLVDQMMLSKKHWIRERVKAGQMLVIEEYPIEFFEGILEAEDLFPFDPTPYMDQIVKFIGRRRKTFAQFDDFVGNLQTIYFEDIKDLTASSKWSLQRIIIYDRTEKLSLVHENMLRIID